MNLLKVGNQRGDTLIEVAIAMAILSITLFHAYNLSSQSSQMGLSAREQGQVTQLMEHQADGLRHMRDQSGEWEDFKNELPVSGSNVNAFHLRVQGGEWRVVNNEGSGEDIIGDAFSRYTIGITGNLVDGDDKLEATIEADWDDVSGSRQTTELGTVLVNVDSVAPPSFATSDPAVTCNNLSANPSRGTKPLRVRFRVDYDVEDTSVTRFEWNFGDGRGRTTGSDSANHRYRNHGTHIARVQVQTQDGVTDSCRARVEVESRPRTFRYEGRRLQYYRVPAGVRRVRVDAYGAQGGHTPRRSYGGGKGGHVQTYISVRPGQRLRILVGGQGGAPSNRPRGRGGDGGWPYGGDGGRGGWTTGSGAGGGGSSEVRAPNNRRLVVAAGGGGSTRNSCSNGGHGHSGAGESDSGRYGIAVGGRGGTSSRGGNGGSYGGQDGRPGYGGNGGTTSGGGGGGGGGGYFGGGGGGSRPYTCAAGGGGGGSYSSGNRTRLRAGVKSNNGRITITPQ